jgi:hypothetical protein
VSNCPSVGITCAFGLEERRVLKRLHHIFQERRKGGANGACPSPAERLREEVGAVG